MRILVFGDSITQGFHDIEMGGWANRLHTYAIQKVMTKGFEKDLSVFNLGISGDTLVRLDKRFEAEFDTRWNDGRGPALTIFAYGINDSLTNKEGEHKTSLDEFTELYSRFIQKAKVAGNVVLVGLAPIDEVALDPVPWLAGHSYLERNRKLFDESVQQLASKYGCTYIPMNDVWDGEVTEYTTDGIHPNAKGHQLMFERIKNIIEKEQLI